MQKKTETKHSRLPIAIIIGVTLVGFLVYFAVHSAVQSRFRISYTESREAGVYAVSGCNKSTDVLTIPATYQGSPVSYILSGSFSDMSIRQLKLEAVKEIGAMAFRNCQSLTDAELGKVEVIGENAFEFCRGLKKVVIPETVKTIGKRAFSFCQGLEEVCFLSDPEDLGEAIFDFCPNVVIYGTPGGNVEAYCSQNGLQFRALEDNKKTDAE